MNFAEAVGEHWVQTGQYPRTVSVDGTVFHQNREATRFFQKCFGDGIARVYVEIHRTEFEPRKGPEGDFADLSHDAVYIVNTVGGVSRLRASEWSFLTYMGNGR